MRLLRPSPLLWTVLTGIVAFCLGFIGYRLSMADSQDRIDTLYRTLQLYVLDSHADPGASWQLRVAEFLAPLSLATAAVVAAATFLRDQWERLLINIFARDHVVVVGLSASSGSVAESLIELGERIVVVESQADHARLPGLRAAGARAIVGDGQQSVTLRRARVDRARHIVITTGDDTINLGIADQVRTVRSTNDRHATVHVAIEDPALWLEVGRLTFGRNRDGTSVECFNRADRTAARLVEVASACGAIERVAVIGSGPTADRVRAHVIRRTRLAGAPAVITTDATAGVPAAIVCHETDGLGEAIGIARSNPQVMVAVAVQSDTADTLLELLGTLSNRLKIVPATSASLAAGFLKDSAIDLMARAKHDDYIAQEGAKGITASENPSLMAWDELPVSLQESNRRFAASVAETLEVVGATLEPLRDEIVPDLAIDTAQLEQLAIREHDRWANDLRKDGWVFASGSKDPIRKTHPLLVAWDELSEEEREKDRDAIRAIPRMLAHAGYTIVVERSA